MQVNDQQITFNVVDAMKSPDKVENYNFMSVVDFTMIERLNSYCSKEDINEVTFEDSKAVNIVWVGDKQYVRADKHFESLDISTMEVKPFVPSI